MRGLRYTALISALALPCLAQSGATPKLVLDEAKPIVYIELDHIGPRPPVEDNEPDRGLWLRLVNNSVVPIEVQTMGTSTDPELTLVPDEIVGRWTRIEESDAPEPKRPMGYSAGHIVGTELLQPQGTAVQCSCYSCGARLVHASSFPVSLATDQTRNATSKLRAIYSRRHSRKPAQQAAEVSDCRKQALTLKFRLLSISFTSARLDE